MRAWGYCRVSSAGQAVEGVSLDAQRARIEAWWK
jgi:DNA invertase Pin-like site-specific DNA recombinase